MKAALTRKRSLFVAAACVVAWAAPAQGASRLERAEITTLFFAEPRHSAAGVGTSAHLDGVKVTILGDGFAPGDAGPIVWVNGIPTQMVRVAPDRRSLDALYYGPLSRLEAASSGSFLVEVQDSPTSPRVAVPGTPSVKPLPPDAQRDLDTRKRILGID
jgi:hypothetical protein